MALIIQNPQDPRRTEKKSVGSPQKKAEFSNLLTSLSQSKPPAKKDPAISIKSERIKQAVASAARKHNLPPALVLGVIKQESGFNPTAKSHCGAQGLMQLMPQTAKHLGVKDPTNIEQNIDGGCRYLRQMMDQFGGDTKLALAAYNAGPTRVTQYKGIPPFAETKNYVSSVMNHTKSFEGVDMPSMANSIEKEMLAMALNMSMTTQAAMVSNINIKTPDLKEESPPPPPPSYAVRV